MGVPWDILNSL